MSLETGSTLAGAFNWLHPSKDATLKQFAIFLFPPNGKNYNYIVAYSASDSTITTTEYLNFNENLLW